MHGRSDRMGESDPTTAQSGDPEDGPSGRWGPSGGPTPTAASGAMRQMEGGLLRRAWRGSLHR
eukprot:9049039-Alexandrium_andersonii.AAC.1